MPVDIPRYLTPPTMLVLDEAAWPVPQPGRPAGLSRRLRVWACAGGGYLAVITESGGGQQIKHVAGAVHQALTARLAGPAWVVEHYPALGPCFDAIIPDDIDVHWTRIPVPQMVDLCGRAVLDATAPAASDDPAIPPSGSLSSEPLVIRGYPDEPPLVLVENAAGEPLGLLPHHVKHSAAGFAWGTVSTGATELARCILLAVLGAEARCGTCDGIGLIATTDNNITLPYRSHLSGIRTIHHCLACDDGCVLSNVLIHRFKQDVVLRWPPDRPWHTTSDAVHSWVTGFSAMPQL